MVKALNRAGYTPVVIDNLSTGWRDSVRGAELIEVDLADTEALSQVFEEHKFEAVMHFAAASLVGESMTDPAKYYMNNLVATLNLLNCMRSYNVNRLVFSSTAAVYGEPNYTPIDESHPKKPINPYGASKWMIEQVLEDYCSAYQFSSIRLRYFNAAGADSEGDLGERHEPETHLIPIVLQAASGRRASIKVYGDDYSTQDGTCVRDYIHVEDLCQAHLHSLEKLLHSTTAFTKAYNLGIGAGFSVRQVIEQAQRVVANDGCSIKVDVAPRRPGDPAELLANPAQAMEALDWTPKYTNLADIIKHAWAWEKKLAGKN